jgi:predicted Zn-dependent protease
LKPRAQAETAVSMAPGSPLFNDTLRWALVKSDKAEEALRYLREAGTRAAGVPDIRYRPAIALHALGRGAEARSELDSALADEVPFAERDEAIKARAALGG